MKTFVAGFGIGAILGLLIAPKRGRETRADLRERMQRLTGSPMDAEVPREHTQRDAGRAGSTTLNTATREQLLAVYGIGPVLADRIIENRPYSTAREVVDRGIISESTFAQLETDLLRRSA